MSSQRCASMSNEQRTTISDHSSPYLFHLHVNFRYTIVPTLRPCVSLRLKPECAQSQISKPATASGTMPATSPQFRRAVDQRHQYCQYYSVLISNISIVSNILIVRCSLLVARCSLFVAPSSPTSANSLCKLPRRIRVISVIRGAAVVNPAARLIRITQYYQY